MHAFFRAVLLALCVAATLASGAAAQETTDAEPQSDADVADAQAYQEAVTQAVREFAAGRWEEARGLFKRAHQIEPNARTLRGMGMAAYELRMYVAALRELDAAIRDQRKPLNAEQLQQAEALIDQANAFVGRYQLILEPQQARPYVDGQPVRFEPGGIVLLDIGRHELRVTADGFRPSVQQIRVDGGQSAILRVTLAPETVAAPPAAAPAPAATKTPAPIAEDSGVLGTGAWIALAGAGAFGAGAGVFWIVGESQYDKLDSCKPDCSDAQVSKSGVETSDLMTNVFLGLAIASGATSAVLFVLDAGGSSGADTAQLRIGPGGVAVSGNF